MSKEHLSVETLEKAADFLSKKLVKIKKLTIVDTGQEKAPKKQAYRDALLAIRREIDKEAKG